MAHADLTKVIKYPISCPPPLQRLPELAFNLWWSWHDEAQDLFREIDSKHWQAHHNPVKLLRARRLNLMVLRQDERFLARYQKVLQRFDRDLDRSTKWFARNHVQQQNTCVAYFSPEFGLHECLPIYSGGLGVLAGDHVKSASDLGLPLVGVSLLYKNGYFTQHLDAQGRQRAVYARLRFEELPVLPVRDRAGKRLTVEVMLAGRRVHVQVWLVQVGTTKLVLLDSDVARNNRADRQLTAQLYGGDREMRMAQEILLGLGGVRALRALGLAPEAWHLNEGHVAFLCLERIRELVQNQRMDFAQACEATAASTVFTTHTPVPAGNESFELPLMHKYFHDFCASMGMALPDLLNLGLQAEPTGWKFFSMTVLALRLARASNGVSALHGRVSREMWRHLWPGVPVAEIPISSITNGVHVPSWIAPHLAELYARYVGTNWRSHLSQSRYWHKVFDIPDAGLWQARCDARSKLIEFVRARLVQQYRRRGATPARLSMAQAALRPEVLTIGFARRFAAYKRADLIFHDLRRLSRIVNHAQRPVQIIFAGKAHPRDAQGQKILQRVFQMTQRPEFWGKVVLVEDYDIEVGRMLVQGVDLWLNNPRRPHEASGTSGQKVICNGGLNLSILDGWWDEGFDGKNGWNFGSPTENGDAARRDAADAADLYRVLARVVVPLYYARDRQGLPRRWLKRVKASMATLLPCFNTHTMVQNYIRELYTPGVARGKVFQQDDHLLAELVARCKEMLHLHWPLLQFVAVHKRRRREGETEIAARIYLSGLDPDWVQIHCFADNRRLQALQFHKAHGNGVYEYRIHLKVAAHAVVSGRLRLMPNDALFVQSQETGLALWSQPV